jgi:DNA-binding PadR family transcriptional regulator
VNREKLLAQSARITVMQLTLLKLIRDSVGGIHGLGLAAGLTRVMRRKVQPGSVYSSLRRLTEYGLVQREHESSPDYRARAELNQGASGRPRVYYTLTPAGRTTCSALEEALRG